ncbi:hypothetical protein FQN57_000547 [Myotisia sp. PD_48]|nr:hypothetical protein FQN57_000547 [Myotisia sp. PD_48]
MESVRRINRWTQEEDAILIQKFRAQQARQQARNPPSSVPDWQEIASALPGRSNKDCRKRWFNVLSGGLRKGAWTSDEDILLRNAVQAEGRSSWMRVAAHVPRRTADQCAKRWQHFLDPSLDRSEWTKDDNQTLLQAVQQHGRKWLEIRNQLFPSRSPNTLKNQYSIISRRHGKLLATSQSRDTKSPSPKLRGKARKEQLMPEYRLDNHVKWSHSHSTTNHHFFDSQNQTSVMGDETMAPSPNTDIEYAVSDREMIPPTPDYSLLVSMTPEASPMPIQSEFQVSSERPQFSDYEYASFETGIGRQRGVEFGGIPTSSTLNTGLLMHGQDQNIAQDSAWATYPSPGSTVQSGPKMVDLRMNQANGSHWSYSMADMPSWQHYQTTTDVCTCSEISQPIMAGAPIAQVATNDMIRTWMSHNNN